jgi:putative hydrolase of the HAD superfamily
MKSVKRLIFDADDTLWDNNVFYVQATQEFFQLCVKAGIESRQIEREFNKAEAAFVTDKGYGSRSYLAILSSLYESHPELKSHTRLKSRYHKIIKDFRQHLVGQPSIFPEVIPTLEVLAHKYELYILTKGNIEEQKQKLIRSKLLHYFKDSFVVSEKNLQTYQSILQQKNWSVQDLCMIGNSPKSDINPALNIGMYAVFIPYQYTWKLEDEALMENHPHLYIIPKFSDLIKLLNAAS